MLLTPQGQYYQYHSELIIPNQYLYIMKYLITESQLDKSIFRYLDIKNFIQIKKGSTIYFANSEGGEYINSLIEYFKSGECVISFELIDEIKDFFSIEFDNSKYVITRWVENTLDRRVKEVIVR